jgi:DNA primase
MDPDDLVRTKGPGAFEQLLAARQPLVDRLWAHELAAEPLDTPEQKAGLKMRLNELAQSIADKNVSFEYQAEFRRRFSDLYARTREPFRPQQQARRKPGEKWKPPDPPVTEAAKGVRARGIDPILAKEVLAGLIRHPAEIARHMEVLGSLKLADGALGRLFEAVVDVAVEDQALDSESLLTILSKSGFDNIASNLLRADQISWSFTLKGAEPARAREDLDEAIAILVARPEVDAALAEATAALMARYSDEAFDRQVSLVKEQQALDARLANLVQANEDARAFSAEGN